MADIKDLHHTHNCIKNVTELHRYRITKRKTYVPRGGGSPPYPLRTPRGSRKTQFLIKF